MVGEATKRAMHWADWSDARKVSPREAALQKLWREFRDRPVVGNEHDRLYAALAFGYDSQEPSADE